MKSAQIVVRAVAKRDYRAWEALWCEYNASRGRAGETGLQPEITQKTWARFFDAYEPLHALVAEENGRLLGMAHVLFHRSTILLAPICHMQDLYTVEEARRRGVGRALVGAVYQHAAAAGSPLVYWQVDETNHAAMRLSDKVAQKSGLAVYRNALPGEI